MVYCAYLLEVKVYYGASVYNVLQQNMRRILLLLPWMAVTLAAAQEAPRPATLRYTYRGAVCPGSLRVGDELLAPASTLKSLGWEWTAAGSSLSVEVGGKSFVLPARYVNKKLYVPMRQAIEAIGGGSSWQKDVLEVWGIVRGISAADGRISFEASLDVRPRVVFVANPPRLCLDLIGARLTPTTSLELGLNSKAGQFNPETVRIVTQTERKPVLALPDATRSLVLDWGKPVAKPLAYEEFSAFLRPTPVFSMDDAAPVLTEFIPSVRVGPLEIVAEKEKSAIYRLRLGRPLGGPAKFKRIGPEELEIVLPGVGYSEGPKLDSRYLREISSVQNGQDSTLRLTLARPLGVEFSSKANELQIMLLVPPVGDGKVAGKVIVVDAGHGGHDSGARDPAKTTNEKDLTLALAKQLSAKLAEQGATVIMTRKTDEFIALRERAEIANRNDADLFISVHINSNRVANTSSGSIIFYHGGNSIGALLAECIRSETAKRSKLPSIGTWSDTRIYDTGFAVLRYSDMPGVLIEVGFINNRKDLAAMRDALFQSDFIEGVVEGIRVYFGNGKS